MQYAGSTKKRQKSENIRTTVHPSDPRPPPPMTISFRVPPAILEFHHEQVNAMNPFDTSNISQNRRRRSLRRQLPSSSMAPYSPIMGPPSFFPYIYDEAPSERRISARGYKVAETWSWSSSEVYIVRPPISQPSERTGHPPGNIVQRGFELVESVGPAC